LHHELDRGFTFSHEVVRGVVYSDLSQPRRKLMHHRVAEALCRRHEEDQGGQLDEELASQIAHHADLGEGHALAARAYITAGKRCLRLFANENAAALARRAMRHARELTEPERCRSMLELLDVQLWARRPDDADQFCRDAQALAETALQRGCVEHARLGFHMISYVRWESGKWDEARIHMLKAEQVMRSGEGKDHVEALAEAGRCLGLLERDLSHAEAFVNEAKARAGQLGIECAILHDAEGMLKEHRGELDAADALYERSRQLAEVERRHFGEIEAMLHRVQLHLDTERYPRALELAHAVAQLADRTRDGSEGPFARVLVALSELALASAGPAAVREALEALRIADAKHRLTYGLTRAATLLNRRALHEEARAVAEEALELSRFLERPSDVVLALVELARAQRALGDQAGWDRSLRQLTERPENKLSAQAERARAALTEEPS
jgi:tetratricopeptide (TPR) repeat protein